jgi:hypothetical protein
MNPFVHIHLEEVILDGLARADRHRAASALQAELVRLLTEQGVPAALRQPAEMPRLLGGSFDLTPGLSPERYGVQAARALYRGLGGEVRR